MVKPLKFPSVKNFRKPIQIERLFNDEFDFETYPHILTFMGEQKLKQYQRSKLNNKFNPYTLLTNIEGSFMRSLQMPVYFRDVDTDKIYILQPVFGGEKKRALNVSRIWNSKKINVGFMAFSDINNQDEEFEETKSENYVAYDINPATKHIYIKDKKIQQKGKGDTYAQILSIGDERWAALLPIV